MTRWIENTVLGDSWVDIDKFESVELAQRDDLKWIVFGMPEYKMLLGPYDDYDEARRMTLSMLGGEDQPDVVRLKQEQVRGKRNESL